MRRLMPVGLWALFLALVVIAAPGGRLLGPTSAYAYGEEGSGELYDQDGGTGGGGGAGASYGDPDGPTGKASRGTPWRIWGGGSGGWRGAAVYGQGQVGFVGRVWTIRNLIVALRTYYLRY